MAEIHVAVIVGSLRKNSYNRQLANALEKLAPSEIKFKYIAIDRLPLYNQDNDDHPDTEVNKFKSDIKNSQALLFLTPEYNRSIPGVLKNAIDHASRPYGQSVWKGKPAGIIGISVGSIGTALAQQHLRNILAYLDVPTLSQPEAFIQFKDSLFDSNGEIGFESKVFLQTWIDAYSTWIRQFVVN